MRRSSCFSSFAVCLVTWLAGIALWPALSSAAQTVSMPQAIPTSVPVGQATQLTVTSQITTSLTDPPLIAGSVRLLREDASGKVIATLGTMRDDGLAGDAAAGDGIFTLQLSVTEPVAGEIRLRVSAAFQRTLRRVLSPVGITPVLANRPPVADAGRDLNAVLYAPAYFDGSQSTDPDGDIISFHWSPVTAPSGSSAMLVDPSSPNPRFTPDVPGDYVFELLVNDGHVDSSPDQVTLRAAAGNTSPNANAGRDQHAFVGTLVVLDGSASYDPDGTFRGFGWSFAAVPAGSQLTDAAISGSASPSASFRPDVLGTYTVRLEVTDGTSGSDVDEVLVFAEPSNVAPNANAGPDTAASAGQDATLDGTGSNDPDGGPSPLSFSWDFLATPSGSTLGSADIVDSTAPMASFLPDVEGAYLLRLKVNDGNKSDEDNTLAIADFTPPTIQFVAPTDGTVVNTRTPTFNITFADTGSGLDLGSYQTTVNGVDVTASTSVTPTGATYSTAAALPPGDNTATARISDRAGNVASATIRFTVSVFRAIADCAPTTGNAPLPVRFRSRGEFTGGTIVQYRWDFQGDGTFDTTDAVALDYSFTFQQSGTFTPLLEVTNNLGQRATDTCSIVVSSGPPMATAQANPSNGPVPLTVTFTGTGTKSNGFIVKHEWDFEGDGVFDVTFPDATMPMVPSAITFTINHATCGGFDDFTFFLNGVPIGTTAGTVGCVCNSSELTFSVTDNAALSNWNPTGPNNLRVDVGSSLAVGYIRADISSVSGPSSICIFDRAANNCVNRDLCAGYLFGGTYSQTSGALGTTQVVHTYTAEGTYNAIFRVTDDEGMTATASAVTTAVRARPPGSPSVDATASVTNGNAPLNVSFNGTATDDGTIVLWEWDFEGDGTFEFSSAVTPATAFTYTRVGIFAATLRVTDDAGLSSTDVIEIVVGLTATLSIPDDTIDPTVGEMATVRTTISAETSVRIIVKDQGGFVVRTLVNQMRPAGTYDDLWDGRDDQGEILPQDPYLAILEYVVAGRVFAIDLTNSTGGVRYNPTRNTLPRTFRPFEDDLLTINFTIPSSRGASEVQAFIGLFNTDTRFVTLLDRVPLGVGTHTIKWDGLDQNGNIAVPPPGDAFLFGIFGFTLPDNAIFLQSAPTLSNVTVDPNFFDPSTPDFLSPANPIATVRYDLNKPADVELTVTNLTTGRVLRRIRQLNLLPGAGRTILWDGRADDGLFVDRGSYRLALGATDSAGGMSLTRYALMRVFY